MLWGVSSLGCNAVTGAGDVVFRSDLEDDAAEGTGSPAGGAGGTSSATGAASGTGAATASTTASSVASGGGVGGDPGPEPCEYPPGPYGVDVGQIVPPTLSWEGFAPGEPSSSTLLITDLFDCDGSRGIHALYFDTSQFG